MSKKIHFENTGRKKQHKITLFEITENSVDIAACLSSKSGSTQSYAKDRLSHYMTQAQAYLKDKGYDDISSHFRLINGEVVKCQPGEVWMPLWAVIEERDQPKGQTGELLAAVIDHTCRMLLTTWPPHPNEYIAFLGEAMRVQEHFFQLFLLENVQPQHSAGSSRTDEANQGFLRFKPDAKSEYHQLKEKYSVLECSKRIFTKLKEKYPNENIPTAETIRDWLKNI